MVRVRFAPSPTGIPHIGNTRTALYNFLFAKHQGGKFVVRIEDTDQARLVAESREKILEILKFLGLTWDEGPEVGGEFGPYEQSKRLELYKKYAQELVEKGMAYYEEKAIRFKIPKGRRVEWEDLIQGKIGFNTDEVSDPVVLKSDGWPTYHLAVVVDDHLMEISHILRAAEWISSTPKHLLIYEALGWQPPQIGHFSVILGPDKAKLSKRHGAKSVLDYRDEGYLPEALLTFMAYLGWSHEDNSALLTLEELAKYFDLKQVHKQNPIFDQKKLDYFNAQLIRSLGQEELLAKLEPFIPTDCLRETAKKALPLVKDRLVRLSEFEEMTSFLYREISVDKNLLLSQSDTQGGEKLKAMTIQLEKAEFTAQALEATARQAVEEKVWRPSEVFMLLRVAITGKTVTPPLFETMEVLGKDLVLSRLAHAQNYFA